MILGVIDGPGIRIPAMKVVQQSTPPEKLPGLVALLGYGGLIPFLAFAIGLGMDLRIAGLDWLHLLLAYGTAILSFVGALHWAFAMMIPAMSEARRRQAYGWSVLPALMGFVALAMDSPLSCTLLIAGFALAYWQDADLANHVDLPDWYPRLRLRLTVIAVACLGFGALS